MLFLLNTTRWSQLCGECKCRTCSKFDRARSHWKIELLIQERKTRGTSVSTRMSGKGPEMPEALSSHSGSVLVKCLKGRKLPCTMSYKCLYAHLPAYTVSPPSSSHGWRNSNTEWSAAVILKLDCAFQSHLKTLLRCMFWFQGAGVEPRDSACLTSSQVMWHWGTTLAARTRSSY